ncbi:thiolase family protein [Candidatus Woesearchaeota archaeon]|nr:thiolase family protein [Candidatus Woesearchaeota archaeon]
MSFIKGVGMTKFGIQEDASTHLVYEATLDALNDAELSMNDVDAIVLSNHDFLSNGERQRHSASQMSSLFQKKLPIITVPAACAGGGTALWTALRIQKSGNYENILVIGFDKLVATTGKKVTDEILMAAERIYEQAEGLNFPAQNALVAQQYMMKHGATTDDFALVAYKNHKNAFLNPKARFYKKNVSLEEIKNSPVVASPLRIFDCSISCNGAAALVLSKAESDVEVVGSGEENDYLSPFEREDMTSLEATRLAAEEAYKQAGVGPEDIGMAEVHDAFTPLEMISYEDLGFCKKGEGKEMIRKGITNIDGKLPVNTSGGLKAKGHPISPTGISQVYEIVKQMRNEAGDRQLKKPKYGLAHNIGGVGSVATVHIFKNLN